VQVSCQLKIPEAGYTTSLKGQQLVKKVTRKQSLGPK